MAAGRLGQEDACPGCSAGTGLGVELLEAERLDVVERRLLAGEGPGAAGDFGTMKSG